MDCLLESKIAACTTNVSNGMVSKEHKEPFQQ